MENIGLPGQNDIMKDLSLSLLSRGCGRIVSSNRNKGSHDGRLDVCFTPQDYYIWKSQDSLLKLSNRGHLLVKEKSTLPKTYSTRRGPLVLYSQDLVTMENGSCSQTVRKQPDVQRHNQQVEQQLSNLKELTAAILSYSNDKEHLGKFTFSRLGLPSFPPLHLPLAPDVHRSSPPPIRTTQEHSRQELLPQLNPQGLHLERNIEQLENHREDEGEKQGDTKRARLGLLVRIPCTSRALTPQMECQACEHCESMTNEEEAQMYFDESLQHNGGLQHTETNHHSKGGELHHANLNCVHDTANNQGCSIQDSETTSGKGNCERPMSGNRHGTIGLLPPVTVGNPVCHRPCWEKMDRATWEVPSSDGHHAKLLPPIAENHTVVSSGAIPSATKKEAQPKTGRVWLQSPKNLNQLHQQPLFLPPLFPGKKEEKNGKQRGEGEKTGRQHFIKERVGQIGEKGGRLLSEKGSLILLEPGEEPPPPVGVLGCVVGRKGPGKQSSLASLQNQLLDLQDPCESSDANRGVVRGILPLELRDLQNGKSVGSLILGPDGEIIQLSVYDNSQYPSQGDGDTRDKALQVLSAEGEKLPWVIVLQSEHTFTVCAEEGKELNTDVPVANIQQHQSKDELLDLHGLTETSPCSPSRHKDKVIKKNSESAAAVAQTWKASKKDAKNNVRMPPLRERVRKKEPRGGNSEAEDDQEEELGSTEKISDLSGSEQSGEKLQFKDNVSRSEQNIDPNEATTEEAVKKKRKDSMRKVADKAAKTTGKSDLKTVPNEESDRQKTLRMKKEGEWQRLQTESDAQSMQSQKQEMMTDREGERGEVKMDEKKEEQRQVERQKKESAGRRRRRARLKHKELFVENHEDLRGKVEGEIKQEMEEESHPKSAEGPPAKQIHSNKTKTNSEEDTDHLSMNADTNSSVQSASSLRSTAAASQFNHNSLRKSAASLSEGTVPASAMGLASSRGRLSSCSTVMVTEEQLMLNPVKPESSRNRKSQEEEKAAALRLAKQAERRKQEVERKRREREEEERKQLEKEQTEERMKNELEEERRKRAEEFRLKKLAEEEERRKREEEEQDQVRREQAQRERERRRQEDRRRQMERLHSMREKEEQRRKAELERLRMEESRRQEEESKKLQEMDESERIEYLRRKEQEEDDRRTKDEEHKRAEEEATLRAAEEARLQADLLARQMALLHQQLAFKRGLELEAGGLEKTQGISRPWIYSYLTLLQLLGPTSAETTTL